MTKATKKARVKVTNEAKLVLPQDIGSFSANFRREAARTVGRIAADPKRLAVFKELLGAFGNYADDRFEKAEADLEVALKNKAVATAEALAIIEANHDRVAENAKAEIARLSEHVAAHEAAKAKKAK